MTVATHHRPRAACLRPVLAVIGAAALFGTTGTAQALGPAGTTALGVGAARLVVGAAALAVIACARRPRVARRWRIHGPALLVGGFAVAMYQLCWFVGLRRTGVALGTIVGIGSGPVFAGVLHRLSGARLSRAWVAGTATTVAGAALLAVHGAGGVSVDPLGLAFMAGAGLSYAVYTVAVKRSIERGLDVSGAIAATFGVGAVLVAPLLAVEPLDWIGSVQGVVMALHLGVVTIGLAYWLYGWGLSHLPVPTVVTLTLAEPVTAALLGIGVLDEHVGPLGMVGAAVIAAGLVVAGRGDQRTVAGSEPAVVPGVGTREPRFF